MRGAILGAFLALAVGGSALASDYVVVGSTNPAIKKGTAVDAGARLAIAAGQTVTLMRASGEITTVRGTANGAVVPGAKLASADAAKFEGLKALLQPPAEGRTFGARRGGVCPPVESLTTLEDILRVSEQAGCKTVARQALEAYIARTGSQTAAN
jgi:hypothetical protein